MPNIKSAKKRVETTERNKARNKAYKSELATGLKKFNKAVTEGNVELVKILYPVTVSLIDESVTRGIIHSNKANRKKADVSSKYNVILASKPAKKASVEKEEKVEVKKEEVKVEEKPEVKKPATKKAPAKKVESVEEPKKKPATTKKAATKKAE